MISSTGTADIEKLYSSYFWLYLGNFSCRDNQSMEIKGAILWGNAHHVAGTFILVLKWDLSISDHGELIEQVNQT